MDRQAYMDGFNEKCARLGVDPGRLSNVKEALEVKSRKPFYKRPVSGTVGRLPAPYMAAILSSTAPFRHSSDIDSRELRDILARAEKDPELENTTVSLGSGRPIEALKRTWKNPRTSIPTKIYGTATWPLTQAVAAATRGDHYDPFADMVVNYNKDPAVLGHELGHAKDFGRRSMPGLYTLGRALPPVALYQEGVASRGALRDLVESRKDKPDEELLEDIRRTNRVLGGAMGSYVGNYLSLTGLPMKLPMAFGGQAGMGTSEGFLAPEHKDIYRKLVEKGRENRKARREEEKKSAKAKFDPSDISIPDAPFEVKPPGSELTEGLSADTGGSNWVLDSIKGMVEGGSALPGSAAGSSSMLSSLSGSGTNDVSDETAENVGETAISAFRGLKDRIKRENIAERVQGARNRADPESMSWLDRIVSGLAGIDIPK